MGRGTLGKVRKGSGSLGEVQERSEDPRGGSGRVVGASGRSESGRGTFGEV